MTFKLEQLLEGLREGLADLPQDVVDRALEYYKAYIDEALEAGRSDDEILKKLGGSEEIIALVRAETSLNNAENNPGPFRMIGAGKRVFGSIASSAARVSMVIGSAIPYTLALGLYVCSLAAFIGAFAAAALMGYGISQTASAYVWEKIGTAGVALLSVALFVAVGLGLWLAANGIARYTLRMLRRGLQRERMPDMPPAGVRHANGGVRKALVLCTAAAVFGLVLLVPSGLALRYFSIWNSMKPEHTALRTWTYHPGEIRAFEIKTMNSQIILKTSEARTDAIGISYEEPDWMKGESAVVDRRIVFAETSRNRLPFMGFVSRHEGMTVVTVEVPRGYLADEVALESIGGHISIDLRARSVRIKTSSGTIRFNDRGNSYAIQASTRNGRITVKGKQLDGRAYTPGHSAAYEAEIHSTDGMIEIE